MSTASNISILDLPNELLDRIIRHVSGGTEQTDILRNRSMPDFARLTNMRLSCKRLNHCIQRYKPEKSKIVYSTNFYPILGLPSRTTNLQITKEWDVSEEEGSDAGRRALQAGTMNDAEIFVFFDGRSKGWYGRDERQDSFPRFEGDLIHYLKAWSVTSGNILENLTTIIKNPTITFERSDLSHPEGKVPQSPLSIDYNLLRLATDWMTQKSKTITFHGTHRNYEKQNCHPLVGVWHGTPGSWSGNMKNAAYVSLDHPIDHKFYWRVTAGEHEQTVAIVRHHVEKVLKWQTFLSLYIDKQPDSWLVSLYPIVDGNEELVRDCQEGIDEVMSEFSGQAGSCSFEGQVTSVVSPVDEPFGEWYV